MIQRSEVARPARRATPVVKKAVAASSYHPAPVLSSEIDPVDYATAKVLSRFSISISTARVVAHLSGMGGAGR